MIFISDRWWVANALASLTNDLPDDAKQIQSGLLLFRKDIRTISAVLFDEYANIKPLAETSFEAEIEGEERYIVRYDLILRCVKKYAEGARGDLQIALNPQNKIVTVEPVNDGDGTGAEIQGKSPGKYISDFSFGVLRKVVWFKKYGVDLIADLIPFL